MMLQSIKVIALIDWYYWIGKSLDVATYQGIAYYGTGKVMDV